MCQRALSDFKFSKKTEDFLVSIILLPPRCLDASVGGKHLPHISTAVVAHSYVALAGVELTKDVPASSSFLVLH